MRFAPKIKRSWKIGVRARLTVAVLGVIILSWVLGLATFRYSMEQDIRRFNQERALREAEGRLRMTRPFGGLTFGPPSGEPPGPPPNWRGRPGEEPGPRPPGPPGPPDGRRRLPRPFFQSFQVQAVGGVLLSLLAGWWLSRRFTRPLSELSKGAKAFHSRNFAHRIPVRGNDEFADVAATMNEMAEQVGAQIDTLEKDAQRRRQILADVAHELRSPVATLEAMAAALRDGVADMPERRTEALGYMIDSAGRMRRLVNDLLEVARLDLKEVPLAFAPTDLREVAEDAVQTNRRDAEKAGQVLLSVEAGEPVVVEADRLRLGQVLDNLLGNAIAYAGAGAELRVKVTEEPPGLVVEDTGVGIAAHHLPFIFDPFYRADAARTPTGNHSGLGLRIARGLVEAHGGTLTLESEEGRGTRAVIAFTRCQTERPG